jgi:hypothetical protein
VAPLAPPAAAPAEIDHYDYDSPPPSPPPGAAEVQSIDATYVRPFSSSRALSHRLLVMASALARLGLSVLCVSLLRARASWQVLQAGHQRGAQPGHAAAPPGAHPLPGARPDQEP